jgi:hypothetical protein
MVRSETQKLNTVFSVVHLRERLSAVTTRLVVSRTLVGEISYGPRRVEMSSPRNFPSGPDIMPRRFRYGLCVDHDCAFIQAKEATLARAAK